MITVAPITYSSVLSDTDILQKIKSGNIVIYPFNRNQLQNCSYDVKLGEYYYTPNKPLPEFINPWCNEHVTKYWGSPLLAKRATKREAELYSLQLGQQYIEIEPLETILCHTEEFIGGKHNVVGKMQTRSSLMRIGISCCKCAGWGDIGYINRWTMEITNHTHTKVILPVGMRVAQIIFHPTGQPSHSYSANGKYQTHDDLDELMRTWTPQMMLPKLYMDLTRN